MNKCHLYVEDVLITGGEYKKSPRDYRGLENIIVVEGYLTFSHSSIIALGIG